MPRPPAPARPRHAIAAALLAALAPWGAPPAGAGGAAPDAGFVRGAAAAPERAGPVAFDFWYPAGEGGAAPAIEVGANAVFRGASAREGAPRAEGPFPLVIVSHGGGGNSGQMAWLAAALAARGYAVALPNHPGSTTGDASPAEVVRVWKRPPDVAAVIDAVLADPGGLAPVDPDRIAVLGFSAGGTTALSVAGGRIDPDRLAAFCDDGGGGMSDCAYLASGGVDLHALDLSAAARDGRDGRVGAAVAVDPGIAGTLTEASLGAVGVPVLLLNLGAEGEVPPAVDAAPLARVVPGARHAHVPGAGHFSFLAECTEAGPAILREDGEPDALCRDPGGRARAEIHAELAGRIGTFLDRALRR